MFVARVEEHGVSFSDEIKGQSPLKQEPRRANTREGNNAGGKGAGRKTKVERNTLTRRRGIKSPKYDRRLHKVRRRLIISYRELEARIPDDQI